MDEFSGRTAAVLILLAMAQTQEGSLKARATKVGCTLLRYQRLTGAGLKHCRVCRAWKNSEDFNVDASRHDGRAALCRGCQSETAKARYVTHPAIRFGPLPHPPRDGDKKQARATVALAVKNRILANPAVVPCVGCGDFQSSRRHEYHHHRGYGARHHLDVIVLCSKCHVNSG